MVVKLEAAGGCGEAHLLRPLLRILGAKNLAIMAEIVLSFQR
jgi:hypothetical protein